MAKYFARIRRPSLRWGLIFGIILGVVEAVYNFAASYITDTNLQLILGYIPAILFLVLGFYAGLRASQETGKWTTGLITGLWVGLIGTVIADLIPLANTFINLQSIVANSQAYIKTHEAQVNNMKPSDYAASDVIVTALLEMLVSIVNAAFFTIIGAGLAGFIGRRRSLAAAPSSSISQTIIGAGLAGFIGRRRAPSSSVYQEALFEAQPTAGEEEAEVADTEEVEIKDEATQ
jgi:hypothetical protein